MDILSSLSVTKAETPTCFILKTKVAPMRWLVS